MVPVVFKNMSRGQKKTIGMQCSKLLPETTQPAAFIFGKKRHQAVLYGSFSNDAPLRFH